MKKALQLAAVGLFVVGFVAPAFSADKPAEPPPVYKVGDVVPEIKLKNAITGEQTSFEKSIKGKAKNTVVLFTNTGCSSCFAELMEVYGFVKTKKKEDFQVYAIAVDKRGEEVVKAYYDQYKIEVNYLVDPDFSIPPMFGFDYTPAMFVMDKGNKIIFMKGGFNPSRDGGKIAEALGKL